MWKRLWPSDFKSRVAIVAVLSVLIYGIITSRLNDRDLERDAAETPGTVIRYERSGRSNHVSVFGYMVNGVNYTSSSIATGFKDCLESKWCIGERYVIRYSRSHPDRAKVMWDKPLPRDSCAPARVGRFIDKAGGRTLMIERTASEQYERSAELGETRIRLKWLDECTYQLFDHTVVTGSASSFHASPQDTITVHIISVDDEGFTYEARTRSINGPIPGRQLYDKSPR